MAHRRVRPGEFFQQVLFIVSAQYHVHHREQETVFFPNVMRIEFGNAVHVLHQRRFGNRVAPGMGLGRFSQPGDERPSLLMLVGQSVEGNTGNRHAFLRQHRKEERFRFSFPLNLL